MKKILLGVIVGLAALVVIVLAVLWFSLNTVLKRGVETVGPYLTKTEVKLDSGSLSPFSGRGELKGLFVGNPAGFKTPFAVKIGTLDVAVNVGSLRSDKIIVQSITIDSAEINLEGSLRDNNLTKIMDNLEGGGAGAKTGATDEKTQKAEQKAGRKILVDDLVIRNAKVNVSLFGSAAAPVTVPEIHLTKLGAQGNGITVAELSQKVFKEILASSTSAVSDMATKLGKDLSKAAKDLSKDGLEKATKGIGDMFKK